MRVSVLIPARNEPSLARTIRDVLAQAAGEIEVVAVCDGYAPDLPADPRLVVLHHACPAGMRVSINEAADRATGTILVKLDAHCAVAQGFDVALAEACEDEVVVTPVRYGLDVSTWERVGRPIAAHYLTYPYQDQPKHVALRARHWPARAAARAAIVVDEDMSFQGSCWAMARTQWDRIGPLSMEGYGPFVQEPQEIGLKTWLGGGRVLIHRGTWYAHWKKTEGQGYALSGRQSREGVAYAVDYWMHDRWPARVHDMAWFIDRFAPVPGWPG